MTNRLTHFAIYTDDLERAKKFYRQVFQWGFASFGSPDFLQIKDRDTEAGELIGALQSGKFSPLQEKITGLECTIGVENVDETIRRIQNGGGEVLLPKTAIPYVGWITKFLDTEGNLLCAMEYNTAAR